MTYRLCTAAILTVVISATSARGQDNQKDLDQLQGTWIPTSMVIDGNEFPEEYAKMITFTFEGDKMIFTTPFVGKGKGIVKITSEFTLDAYKNPKTIESTVLDGISKGEKGKAIYELKGDELKLCSAGEESKDIPSEFKSTPGSGVSLITLKKKKSE